MRTLFAALGMILIAATVAAAEAKPKLLDLGSKACIPCRLMAPILDDMTEEFAGTLDVKFADVGDRENAALAKKHGIRSIPTQIFLSADGKELWRHEGFISRYGMLEKWRELGYDFAAKALASPLKRYDTADKQPAETVCFMCDGPVEQSGQVSIPTDKGAVELCGMHHYFVMLSCLKEGVEETEAKAIAQAADSDSPVAVKQAVYLVGADEETGRPWIKAFAGREAAESARRDMGGSLLAYSVLKRQELAARCGFCDRSVYPQDASIVKINGIHSFGCCAHCSMGVASRTGANIEVHEHDALTGEPITIHTYGGYVVSVKPATAVAWYGKRQQAGGTWGSAGCFHQGFFASADNLRKWLEAHPLETGEQISIDQSLADKMRLTPQQIANACKVGECAPK